MILRCGSFQDLRERIEYRKKKIVMFGAGAVGQVTAPEILGDLGLLAQTDCYLDNDEAKWGTFIEVCGRKFEIRPPAYLEECKGDTVIILNISRFPEVIRQLDSMSCAKNMDCYIMPMMLIHNFCQGRSEGEPELSKEALIPKKLHYMWLGKKPVPDKLKKCISSWKEYCPDYEIIEWNEDNYDVSKHIYMKDAYEAKAYGYVPDYARIDILYSEGGFYLDTDVEIRRGIDGLRYQQFFCGVEKWQLINFGGLSGAVKGHPMLKEFLDSRQDISFYDLDGNINRNTCGFYDTRVALAQGYRINGKTQCVNGMNIYASDYFHPFDYMSGMINETGNTYSVHWFNGGWIDEKMKEQNDESKRVYMGLYHKALKNCGTSERLTVP